jgi:RHH-type transcriptional regulator, rel operon repressor / antitoxin RelB
MSTTITIRLEDKIEDRLNQLAELMHRSKSSLVAEAIRAFVERNDPQVKEIHAAQAEAEAGDFASSEDVRALSQKWGLNTR